MKTTTGLVRATVWCALFLFCAPAFSQITRKAGSAEVAVQFGTSTDCTALTITKTHGLSCLDRNKGLLTWSDPDGDGQGAWASAGGESGSSYVLSKSGSTYVLTGKTTATGTDPGALLQTAVTALASAGGAITVQSGTYVPTTAVNLGGTTGVTIQCADGAIFQRTSGMNTTNLFTTSSALSKFAIRGCTFDNNSLPTAVYDILIRGGSTDVEIADNRWINLDARDNDLDNNGTGENGVNTPVFVYQTGGHSYRLRILRNTFTVNTPINDPDSDVYAANAIQVSGWSDVLIEGNRIYGYGAIKYDQSSTVTWEVSNIQIVNNSFRQVEQTHIFVRPSGAAAAPQVMRNIVVSGNVGIFDGQMLGSQKGLVNVGERNGGSSQASDVYNVTIANNVGIGMQGAGLNCGDSTDGRCHDVSITGNVMDGRDSTGSIPTASIFVPINTPSPASTNITINGNTLSYSIQSCVFALGHNVTISGNTLDHCVQGDGGSTTPTRSSAILVSYCKNCTITGNTITRPFTAALAASYVTGGITVNKQASTVTRDILIANNAIIDDRDDGVSDLDGDGTTAASDERGMEYGIKYGVDTGASVAENVVATNNVIKGATIAAFYDTTAEASVLNRLQWGNLYNWTPVTPKMPASNTGVFEGATADAYETTLAVTDPTADRTITLPDASGTVAVIEGDGTNNDHVTLSADIVGPQGANIGSDGPGSFFYPGRRRSLSGAYALAKRGETPVTFAKSVPVVIAGDSISTYLTRPWFDVANARWGMRGLGFDPLADTVIYANNAFRTRTTTLTGWTIRHPGGTAPANVTEWGVSGSSISATGGSPVTISYAVNAPVAINRARIWAAATTTGGTLTYTANGGASTTLHLGDAYSAGTTYEVGDVVNQGGTLYRCTTRCATCAVTPPGANWTATTNPAIAYTTNASGGGTSLFLTSAPSPNQTLTISYGTGTVYVYGVETFSEISTSSAGVMPESNNVVPIWLTAGSAGFYDDRAYDSDGDGTGTATTTLTAGWSNLAVSNNLLDQFLDVVQPAEWVWFMGANDGCIGGSPTLCVAGSTAAQYKTDVQATVDAVQAYMANPIDMVFITTLPRGANPGSEYTPFATRRKGFRKALFEIAAAEGYSVADAQTWWPDHGDAITAGLLLDGVHPSTLGSTLIDQWIGEWLFDSGWKPTNPTTRPTCGSVASAATITAQACNDVSVTGSTAVDTVTACDAQNVGRLLTLRCAPSATWTIATGGAGNLDGVETAFSCASNRAITLTCDGTNWLEVGRTATAPGAAGKVCNQFGYSNVPANATTVLEGGYSYGGHYYGWLPPTGSTLVSAKCQVVGAAVGGSNPVVTVYRYGGTNAGATDLAVTFTAGDADATVRTDTACTSRCSLSEDANYVRVSIATDVSYTSTTADYECTVCASLP